MNANLYKLIAEKSGVKLRPANESQLLALMELGVPQQAVNFYREAEPAACAEIAEIRLWPIKDVIEENTKYVPGCYVRPHGYIVFSTTIFGDTYCFDLNSATSSAIAPVVLLSHEIFDETTTKEEIGKVAKSIAPDLPVFLDAFAARAIGHESYVPLTGTSVFILSRASWRNITIAPTMPIVAAWRTNSYYPLAHES